MTHTGQQREACKVLRRTHRGRQWPCRKPTARAQEGSSRAADAQRSRSPYTREHYWSTQYVSSRLRWLREDAAPCIVLSMSILWTVLVILVIIALVLFIARRL